MIPMENSLAGRVADIHHLLPTAELSIIGEYFLPISHNLLGLKGAQVEDLEVVQSHVMALGACRDFIRQSGLRTEVAADTAGSARQIAEIGDPKRGAIATPLAAEIYGLDILVADIADASHNTTRFIILSREAVRPEPGNGPVITSFVYRVRNVPAALYKGLGGFASNNVNMTKLGSYLFGGLFFASQVYAEIEGHPVEHSVALGLVVVSFFSAELRIVGVYPASPFRANIAEPEENRDLRPSPEI